MSHTPFSQISKKSASPLCVAHLRREYLSNPISPICRTPLFPRFQKNPHRLSALPICVANISPTPFLPYVAHPFFPDFKKIRIASLRCPSASRISLQPHFSHMSHTPFSQISKKSASPLCVAHGSGALCSGALCSGGLCSGGVYGLLSHPPRR